jgi:hypothetical protein
MRVAGLLAMAYPLLKSTVFAGIIMCHAQLGTSHITHHQQLQLQTANRPAAHAARRADADAARSTRIT